MIDSFIPIVAWGFYAFHFSVDRKYMELPNGVNGAIALSAISTLYIQNHSVGLMESGLVTAVILFVVFLLFALLGPMGGGDIKMMAATGLFFVVWDIPSLLFFGFLIGTIQGVALMMIHKQKKDTLFAFGPALILGILMVVFIKGGGVIV